MATDSSPVQNKLIIAVGGLTIVTLVGLKFVFDSYYASMIDEVNRTKLAPTTELTSHREAEKKRLSGGVMPIEKAMAELASKGREAPDALGSDLAPRQSDDLGPMTGWVRLPKAAPHSDLPAPVPHAMDVVAGDAGATTLPLPTAPAAGDAGAAPPTPHGEPPKPPPIPPPPHGGDHH